MYTTQIGFHYLIAKINMHTYICVIFIIFFFLFVEMGTLDKLPSPEETNQS